MEENVTIYSKTKLICYIQGPKIVSSDPDAAAWATATAAASAAATFATTEKTVVKNNAVLKKKAIESWM